jgi:hypothetical protein
MAAGLIDKRAADAATLLKSWHGGDEGTYLVELGCIDEHTHNSAVQILSFMKLYDLSPDHAVTIMKSCSTGLSMDDALAQMRGSAGH